MLFGCELCKAWSSGMIKLIVLSAAGGSVAGLLFLLLFFYSRKGAKKEDGTPATLREDIERNNWAMNIKETRGIKLSMYDKSVAKLRLHDLRKATNDFSNDNIIDSGRRGITYKATLSNGSLVAVKRLQNTQQSKPEFLSELMVLGKVKHANLISLVGFCTARKERLLVYEYMPKRTLYQELHQLKANKRLMEWPSRLNIALGVARGLAWLHHNCNPCIVHRNISSKSIILDQDNEPRISDFGSALLMNPLDTQLTTFINGHYGNMGYVAPEYTRVLVATPKGDVYSFGILLLELITGKVPTQEANPPYDFKQNFVEWIDHHSQSSFLLNAVDKSLTWISCDDELVECLKVAKDCVASVPEERPTMLQVYQHMRIIGNRYGFSVDDEIPIQPKNNIQPASSLNERILSQEIHEIL